MLFMKKADHSYQDALALAKADGVEIIATVDDRIICKGKNGNTRSYYFSGPAVAKRSEPEPAVLDEAACLALLKASASELAAARKMHAHNEDSEANAERNREIGEAWREEWESTANERDAAHARQMASADRLVAAMNRSTDMTTKNDNVQDVEVTKDELAEAIAVSKNCDLATAYKAIATAEKMGDDAVHALAADVEALLTKDSDIQKAARNRAVEIRKAGERRTKNASRQEALREQLYDNPETFGYERS